MQVSEAIKMLTENYTGDEEVVIMWWDADSLGYESVSNGAMAYADLAVNEDEYISNTIFELAKSAVEDFVELGDE